VKKTMRTLVVKLTLAVIGAAVFLSATTAEASMLVTPLTKGIGVEHAYYYGYRRYGYGYGYHRYGYGYHGYGYGYHPYAYGYHPYAYGYHPYYHYGYGYHPYYHY
jgi:hypothetical protein